MNARPGDFEMSEFEEYVARVAMRAVSVSLRGPISSVRARFQEFDYGQKLGVAISYKFLESAYWRETATEETEHVPATWWQAVRVRWLPTWWLNRWPAKMRAIVKTTTVKEFHVCPHIEIPDRGGDRYHFAFLRHPRLREGR